jgi:hypothetical protein
LTINASAVVATPVLPRLTLCIDLAIEITAHKVFRYSIWHIIRSEARVSNRPLLIDKIVVSGVNDGVKGETCVRVVTHESPAALSRNTGQHTASLDVAIYWTLMSTLVVSCGLFHTFTFNITAL